MLRLRTFGGLWIEDSRTGADAGPRPRPLALLAILAVAGAKGLSRDRVLGVLWPETDEDKARQSLSQAIYSLRRDLGIDVAGGGAVLRLDATQISSDVDDFRRAAGARNWSEAASLYTGPFLDGFYLADAPEFERWAESERATLATQGIRAIENAAKASADEGRLEEAAEHWHHLTRLDPTNTRIAQHYMEALARLGDRAAAIAHGRAHADVLRRELETEPDAAFERYAAQLRQAEGISPPATVRQEPILRAEATASRRAHVLPRGGRVGLVAAAAVIAGIAGWRWLASSRSPSAPVLAVGRIRDLAVPDSAAPGAVLREMLATSLGRLSGMQVIANSRMLELTPRDADTSSVALNDAARRAGATEIVEGELIPLPNRQLRLEIRRVGIAGGRVLGGYRVLGSDRVALFDSVTALIAADFRVGAPSGSLAEVTTRSPVAYRFYEEGLRSMFQFDAYAANRLFQAAVHEDSTFAMATYYAWRTARYLGDPNEGPLADRAVALASRAPPRERLLILAHVGAVRSDPRALAAAETLAANYPRDPEALVRAAEAVTDLPRAIQLLDRAVALDSAANPPPTAPCRLCDALNLMTSRYEWADSVGAVQRTLERWHRFRPNDAGPWLIEADWLIGFGRRAEAERAVRKFEALGGTRTNVHLTNLTNSLRLDDFDEADRACKDGLVSADSSQFVDYRWYCAIALRMEGRYREAFALLHDGRIPSSTVVRRGYEPDRFQTAIVRMETDQPLVAADDFLVMFRPAGARAAMEASADTARSTEGLRARYATWVLTLSATAAVEGTDTARARRLVDTIQVIGQRSLFPRDPLLHHFVRGLLFSRAQQHDAAVRELRAAMQSPTFGYTRINYELASSLLALGRPAEGIPPIQAALHGGLEGAGLYVTRTELHELLARLFDAAHQRDSAVAHYAIVERAWRWADPALEPRYHTAQAYLAAHSR